MNELHATHIDVGCYVADALELDERAAFEAHLIDCESCSLEVVEFSETSAELARLVAMTPPPVVRGSTLSLIRTVRPLPPLIEPPRALSLSKGALSPSTSSGELPPRADLSQEKISESGGSRRPVDQLAIRRSARGASRNRVLTGLVAAAAVVALVLGGLVSNLTREQPTDLAAGAAQARRTELLSAADAKIYTARSAGAQYSFVVSRQRNTALFLGTDLANPGPGKAYQLWTLQGKKAIPDALVAASASSEWFEGSIADATALAVTVEPAAGASQPTPPILAVVTI